MTGSANVCARGRGDAEYGAGDGALASEGYGECAPVCGLSSEPASPYPDPGISFSTTPVGTVRLWPLKPTGGGGVACLVGSSGVLNRLLDDLCRTPAIMILHPLLLLHHQQGACCQRRPHVISDLLHQTALIAGASRATLFVLPQTANNADQSSRFPGRCCMCGGRESSIQRSRLLTLARDAALR